MLPPPAIAVATPLADCLMRGSSEDGQHAFAANPEAIDWLISAAASGGGLPAIELAERVPIAEHRAQLPTLIRRGKERLEYQVRCT